MRKPWHVLVVGVLALLWNGFGAADYTMTQLGVSAWTGQMPEGLKQAIAAYPRWMEAVWALAVWSPVLAALLLIGGRKAAALWFGVGLIFFAVAAVWNYALAPTPLHVAAGDYIVGVTAGVGVIAVLQWVYARAMSKRGVLE